MKPLFLALMASLVLPLAASAQESVQGQITRATLLSKTSGVIAGQTLTVGVLLEPKDEWHTYWKDPGDAGIPTTLEWTLPEGFTAGDIQWPPYTVLHEGTLKVNAYKGTVLLPVDITVPQELSAQLYPLKVRAEWLVCHDICIPESADLEMMLPVVQAVEDSASAHLFTSQQVAGDAVPEPTPEAAPQAPVAAPAVPSGPPADTSLFLGLLLSAMLGGLILNLMPCVLPVLSLKALALVKKSAVSKRAARRHGLAYTLGVMVSFAGFAAVLIGLQHSGQAIGWGFQMQSPGFVGFLVVLLYLVGLNLSGLFHLPVLLGNVGTNITSDESSMRGSFFTGVLATAVATPCTAPFMASAVGVALTLPSWQAMLVFEALAFGLALPFLLIACFPKVLRFLPKPGAWMDVFKQFLAFGMYGSAIWLVWVLTLQVGAGGMALLLWSLLLITVIIWMKALFKDNSAVYHGVASLLVALILLFTLSSLSKLGGQDMPLAATQAQDVETYAYSEEKLTSLRAEGKTVLVDATAAWCITCQVNARTSIHTSRVMAAFKEQGAVLMIADWTLRNSEITQFLAGFGYNGVPLYVVYKPGSEPNVLPQILSEDIVIEAISR